MSLVLELPPDLEKRLVDAASREGLGTEVLAIQLVDRGLSEPPKSIASGDEKKTWGRRVLEQWEREGLLGIWADREDIGDSVEYARKLREEASNLNREPS